MTAVMAPPDKQSRPGGGGSATGEGLTATLPDPSDVALEIAAPPLHVPEIDRDDDVLTAAFAYVKTGWFVGPMRNDGKHPGSLLGRGWPTATSQDPKQLAAWFAGTDLGLFLHAGRSGALILDVDDYSKLHEIAGAAIAEHSPPFQSTRENDQHRGHYIFAQPTDRMIGNGAGNLGKGWGEVRGNNGIVVVQPTRHKKAAMGGRYKWITTGPVPYAQAIANELTTATDSAQPATKAAVQAFLDTHTGASKPHLLAPILRKFDADVAAGGSRHDALRDCAAWACRDAAAGILDAKEAMGALWIKFRDAMKVNPDPQRFPNSEFASVFAWAVAQGIVDDSDKRREEIEDRLFQVEFMNTPSTQVVDDPAKATPDDAEIDGDRKLDSVHHGQVRIAYRLAAKYGGRLMFVPKIGWHTWDGTRWALDERGAATRAVLATLRKALADSLGDSDLRVDVRKCEGDAAIRGVLNIASNLEAFVAAPAQLDADPYLINCANGTLDLRTMTLRAHDPTDRITKVTRASYRPADVGSGAWSTFLERVLPDTDVRSFLQRVIGVALLGKVIEHVLPILTGTGANGKGVTYGALLHALGDYAAPAEPDLFMAREGAHPTGQMDLFGRRLVVVSESDRNRRLAEATMKRLTGGDPIKARYMRQEFVTFTPSHLAILVTNHLPKVSGDDDAIWRRVRVVPFDVVIPEDERDVHLGEALELEADAALAWAVAGYADYAEQGLAEPESVRVATEAYRTDSDAVKRFLAECCDVAPHAGRETTGALFARWADWASKDGAEAISQKAFGQSLDRHGLPAGEPSNGRRWRVNVKLLPPQVDTDETERSPF